MAHEEDDFQIRPGEVGDRGGGQGVARRTGVRVRPASFVGEVHQAIRRAGGNPDRPVGTGREGSRFNARGRGAAVALTLKDRSAWSRDASGVPTPARREAVKARGQAQPAARSRPRARAVDAPCAISNGTA